MDTNLKNSLNFMNSHLKKIYELDEVKGRIGIIKSGKKQIMPQFVNAEGDGGNAGEGVDKANKTAKKEKHKK